MIDFVMWRGKSGSVLLRIHLLWESGGFLEKINGSLHMVSMVTISLV